MNQLVAVSAAPAFSVSDVEKVATAIAKGGLFGSKDPYAVLTLCLLAQAEGQHPAVVFRDYHIISGKPAKKAEAMLRDFLNAGGKIEWHQLDDEKADATFSHPAGGSARISWDHARAVKAQIAGNAMYKKYPRQMLRSRTISEGVRTIYPGATSGLYVEEEVAGFEPAAEPRGNANSGTIEAHPERRGDAELGGKVAGIHKIKQNIRAMKERGNASETAEGFDAILVEFKDDMNALEAAGHSWWTGKDKDGNDFEGIPAWIDRRRSELAGGDGMFKMLIDSLNECETLQQLTNWMAANEAAVEALDDAERRKFELARDFRESLILEMDKVNA